AEMRDLSDKNDANRALLLALTGAVVAVILVTVAAELIDRRGSNGGWGKALVIATLTLAWLFSNIVYALHYAHPYYPRCSDTGAEWPRAAIRQAVTIIAAPIKVSGRTGSAKKTKPNRAAQTKELYSTGARCCASARA